MQNTEYSRSAYDKVKPVRYLQPIQRIDHIFTGHDSRHPTGASSIKTQNAKTLLSWDLWHPFIVAYRCQNLIGVRLYSSIQIKGRRLCLSFVLATKEFFRFPSQKSFTSSPG
jgi:hypothetical protein